MAKKKTQTLEEALLPDSEQPYSVPENWVWVSANMCFEITSSKRVHKSDWLDKGIPFYRTRELVVLSDTGIVENELFISYELYSSFKREYGVPQINDLLISGVGTIGVPYVINNENPFYFKDGNIIWFKNRGSVLPQYMFHMYKSLFMKNQIKSFSSGTTVDTYTIVNANKTLFPLPPLVEQRRIVARIESLFEKLDHARELVQSALDSFETRKAAILHKAFTGELTAQWRTEHGVGMDSWEETTLSKNVIGFKYGTSEKADYSFHGMPVIRIPNIQSDSLSLDDLKYLSSDMIDVELHIKENDILIIRSNGSRDLVGKSALVPALEQPYTYASYLIRIRPKENLASRFAQYFLSSSNARSQMFSSAKSSAGIHNINSKELGSLELKLPSLTEQTEIVRILDGLFDKEQKAKEQLEPVLDQIDLMKKTILARAFRGELGTNNPSEESALGLLKNMLTTTDT